MSVAVLSAGKRPATDHSVLPVVPDPVARGSIEIRLTRAEYWLLLHAATMRLPLWVIAAAEGPPWGATIQEALNGEGHGLARDALASTLQRLARRRWIRLLCWSIDGVRREFASLSRRALAVEFDRRPGEDGQFFYELTSRGGRIFEAFARPDWAHYIEDWYPWNDDEDPSGDDRHGERRIVAADRFHLDRYLDAVRSEHEVVAGSEVFRELADWQPIYWKPPRPGIECRLRCRDRPPSHERTIRSTDALLRRWCEWGG